MKARVRIGVVLPLAVFASVLPVVGGDPAPDVRTWKLDVADGSTIRAPDEFALLGVSWPESQASPSGVRARTSSDGADWSPWTTLEIDQPQAGPDRGSDERGTIATQPAWVGSARFAQVRFTGAEPEGAKLDVVDPGPDPSAPASSAVASPSQPGIISRARWGADERIRRKNPSISDHIKLAIVHHTATADSYSKSQSDDIVRGIYAYHVKSNGWDDIGYNFIVDRHGQIFEGRFGGIARNVVGAHSQGFNKHSTGIAILGNFAGSKPPEVAMQALKKITAWRLDKSWVEPGGSHVYTSAGSNKWANGTKVRLRNVVGHRDVGRTECPGNPLQDALQWLRVSAKAFGMPKLFDLKISRPVITPNGDDYASGTRLTGRFSTSRSWRVDVLSSGGSVMATWRGSGTSVSVPWTGLRTGGAIVPHGDYRFKVTASGISTSYRPFKVWRWPNGTFFQTTGSKTTYVMQKGKLRHPTVWMARATHYKAGELIPVPDNITSGYPVASRLGFREGTLIRANGKIYLISERKRRPISTSTMSAMGYNTGAIIDTNEKSAALHKTGPTVTAAGGYPNGSTLRSSLGFEAWKISGVARRFATVNVRTSWLIRDVERAGPADSEVNAGGSAPQLGFRDGSLIRASGDPQIYVIADGKRLPISAKSFSKMGYKPGNIRAVSTFELGLHQQGPAL
ncbi:MAG: N-acetylmuramoyl-L-alanine amidase [Actinomycetota bacterium]